MLHPITVKAAAAWVRATHRHLPELQGGLFAVSIRVGDELRGVAVAGNPARVWQGTGRILISRVSTDGAENGCSMLYGAICRAAKALGYREAWTYTLPHEPGTSLRAAGFIDMGLTGAGEWSRPSRSRAAAIRPEPKRRWMRPLASVDGRRMAETENTGSVPQGTTSAVANGETPTPSSGQPGDPQ